MRSEGIPFDQAWSQAHDVLDKWDLKEWGGILAVTRSHWRAAYVGAPAGRLAALLAA